MAHALRSYVELIEALRDRGYSCYPIREYFIASAAAPCVYLRHDVDRKPERAVAMAKAESALGVQASYYFRCDRRMRFPAEAMHRIADLGHETGFHYESLSRCRGDAGGAVDLFGQELAACRAILPVQTVAPHGAPLSAMSNMDFSTEFGQARFGLLGDATAIDFSQMLYITDTGGTFGSPHNLRDRVAGRALARPIHPLRLAPYLIEQRETRVVLSCHPERWALGALPLAEASLRDGATNLAKWLLKRLRGIGADSQRH